MSSDPLLHGAQPPARARAARLVGAAGLVGAATLVGASGIAAADDADHAVDVPRVATAGLDGGWSEGALAIGQLARRSGKGRQAAAPAQGFAASLRLAWSDGALLVALDVRAPAVAESPDLDGIPAHDGVEIVLADGRDPLHCVQLLASPGVTPAQPTPRLRFIDRRIRRFHDPRLQRDLIMRLDPLRAEARSTVRADGYALELRLPWTCLGIAPAPGVELGLQVSVAGRDAAGAAPVQAAWFPRGWASSDPRCTQRIRLAGPGGGAAQPLVAADEDDPRFVEERCSDEDCGIYAYLPRRAGPLRAVHLTLPGSGMSTPVRDRSWSGHPAVTPPSVLRAFADAEGVALVGASYAWVEPAQALAAITRIGARAGRPELATAPLIVDGFSAGGKWTHYRWLPELADRIAVAGVLGFLTGEPLVKDGMTYPFALGDAACAVPTVFHVGAADSAGFKAGAAAAAALLREHRPRGAPWALAVAPRLPHIVGAATLLTLPFYRDALALRLGPDGRLRPIDPARGWLGDPSTGAAHAWADYPGDRAGAWWFPSRFVARCWRLVTTTRDLDITVADLQRLLREEDADG